MTKQESDKKQIDFIRMRSQGMSFDFISQQINVSKTSLIKWSHELKGKIFEAQADSWQTIKEEMKINLIDMLREKAELYSKLKENLKKVDVSELSIDKQYNLMLQLETEFNNLNLKYNTGITEDLSLKSVLEVMSQSIMIDA